MGDTLLASLTSVLEQLNDEFEVLVVDDDSIDSTQTILEELKLEYKNLVTLHLGHDKNRRLGFTRNTSLKHARGEWCIFHIDMDDQIGPHIIDFVKTVEVINSKFSRDLLFSGQQIHMAKRTFLIENGPFRNIYRGEDRDLYQRLAFSEQWITIIHKRFIHRLPRSKKLLLKKVIRDSWDQMVTDLQMDPSPIKYLFESAVRLRNLGLVRILFRFFFVPYALITAYLRGILDTSKRINNYEDFAIYRKSNSFTLSEWTKRLLINETELKGIDRKIFY